MQKGDTYLARMNGQYNHLLRDKIVPCVFISVNVPKNKKILHTVYRFATQKPIERSFFTETEYHKGENYYLYIYKRKDTFEFSRIILVEKMLRKYRVRNIFGEIPKEL